MSQNQIACHKIGDDEIRLPVQQFGFLKGAPCKTCEAKDWAFALVDPQSDINEAKIIQCSKCSGKVSMKPAPQSEDQQKTSWNIDRADAEFYRQRCNELEAQNKIYRAAIDLYAEGLSDSGYRAKESRDKANRIVVTR